MVYRDEPQNVVKFEKIVVHEFNNIKVWLLLKNTEHNLLLYVFINNPWQRVGCNATVL